MFLLARVCIADYVRKQTEPVYCWRAKSGHHDPVCVAGAGARDFCARQNQGAALLRPDADRLIREFNPDAKVLAILRDPVARAYSSYLMYCRLGKTKDSFLQEVERALNEAVAVDVYNPVGLRMGLYADDLQRYQDTFGDAFRVLLFEDLVQEPDKVLRSLLEFLGIALPGQLPELGEHNAFGISRSPLTAWLQQQHRLKQVLRHLLPLQSRAWITRHLLIKKAARPEPDAVAIRKLVAFYRDDVLATARFLQRPELPWNYFDGSFPRPQ